jgi:hypothetical protein
VFYIKDASVLTPPELESAVAAIHDADIQAGVQGGLTRRASSGRAVENAVAKLGRRTLGLDSSQVAGHTPDASAGGSPLGPIIGIPNSVNASWGGQIKRYKPGFVFEGFSLFDKTSKRWLYTSGSLEHAPPPI